MNCHYHSASYCVHHLSGKLHPPEKEYEGIPVELPPPPEGLLLSGLLLQVIIKLQ